MKSSLIFSSLLLVVLNLQPSFSQNTISGTITYGQNPIQGASVLVKGTSNGTSTDAMGKYSISASPKEILVFSYVGLQTVEIIVEDVTKVLNVRLFSKVEQLDQVTVTGRKRKTQKVFARNYFKDPTIINTNSGYLSPSIVGYHLRVIDGRELNPQDYDILEAITNKIPGTVIRSKEGVKYLFPNSFGSMMPEALGVNFEVDGNILYNSNPPLHLDINKVIRVALIYPDDAIRLYGGRVGGPGVIIINTSDVMHGSTEDGNRPYNHARLRNNVYTNDALIHEAVLEFEPSYLKELYGSNDDRTAYDVYEKYVTNFGSSYAFVVDTYRCLVEHFSNKELAERVLKNHKSLFEENPLAMKALAYIYQENGDINSANNLYKKLFVKRSNYVQSYVDLARSYREIGRYEKAAQLYSRLGYLSQQGYFNIKDSMMVSKVIDREFNNLLALEGDEILSGEGLPGLETVQHKFQGTRLVFEWNDGEAEFELQFVNPEGRYYKTEHSLLAVGEQIREQKILGYTMEEFLIEGFMPGQWLVNVKYLGNKGLSPIYLKSSVYHAYGTADQRKESKVFKLGLKNVNLELFKVDVSSISIND